MRTETWVELALLGLLIWAVFEAGQRTLIAPKTQQRAGLVARISEARSQRETIQQLKAQLAACRTRQPAKRSLVRMISHFFPADEADRTRLMEARDTIASQFKDLQLDPDTLPVAPTILSFRTTVDLNEELKALKDLKDKYLNPPSQDEVAPWKVPTETSICRLEERFSIGATYPEFFDLLAKIQSQPVFLEVTQLKAQWDLAASGREAKVAATISVSSLAFKD